MITARKICKITCTANICAGTTSLLLLTLLLKDSAFHQFKWLEDSALFQDGSRMRGHGAWSDAPYVRMVTSAGHVEHRSSHTRVEYLNNTVGTVMSATPFPVRWELGFFFFCIPVSMEVVHRNRPVLSSPEEYSVNDNVSNSTSSQMKGFFVFFLCILFLWR